MKIGIIGAGNLGKAIVDGLLESKVSSDNILIGNVAAGEYKGIEICSDNIRVAVNSNIIILVVKPNIVPIVLKEIKEHLSSKVVLCFAAGLNLDFLESFLGQNSKVKFVRGMTNLAVKNAKAISVYKMGKLATLEDKKVVEWTLSKLGSCLEVKDEKMLDLVTGVSGSGIAYFVKIIDIFVQEAIKGGMDICDAKKVVLKTVGGAVSLLDDKNIRNNGENIIRAEDIIRAVASKGGTTEQGLKALAPVELGLKEVIFKTVEKCKELGGNEIRSEVDGESKVEGCESELDFFVENAKLAKNEISKISSIEKNRIILNMADILLANKEKIIEANKKDLELAKDKLGKYMLDRLTLTESRIRGMVASLREIAGAKDYVGEIVSKKRLSNGLELIEKRFGMGVVLVIFEARPNVVSDVVGLCLKSSCSVILKGGSHASNSLKIIVELLNQVCSVKNLFQLVTKREDIKVLLKNSDLDLVIPRGGKKLIDFVKANSNIPVLAAGKGNCHIFVDDISGNFEDGFSEEKAVLNDFDTAIRIIVNAKTQRPTVCNAAEKVLVHKNIAEKFLPKLGSVLKNLDVKIKGCEKTRTIIDCELATDLDWDEEYLALTIGIKIVDDVKSAIKHINKYSSKHSEAIITNNEDNKNLFLNEVDSACVYSNASTRFTDGFEFGLGAEIGISTQKVHARGPMGLKALTSTKYLILGDGQIRG